MRRLVLALAAVALVVGPPVPHARAAVPVLVIDGRGFGHGVGMAQDGALSMGQAGASLNQILGQFYPGTAVGRKAGFVRVPVLVAPSREAYLSFPNGGQIRDTLGNDQSPGFPIDVAPGGRAHVWFDGRYHVDVDRVAGRAAAASAPDSPVVPAESPLGEPTTTLPVPTSPTTLPAPGDATSTTTPPPTTAPPASSPAPAQPAPGPGAHGDSPRPLLSVPVTNGTVSVDARGRRYRGFIEANAAQGPLRLVNQVDVEQYLRGMGEVRNPKWPLNSLKAQAVAARTYALRAMASVGELCDDQRCQVYLGQQAEYPQMDRAVRETQGQVIVWRSQLASTVYSANGGGFEASPAEGFGPGASAFPYLRAAPYLSKDPLPWTVRVGVADLAARFGYRGQVTAVRVSQKGPSGRAVKVAFDGSAGTREVDGVRFDAALGLKSTLFDVRIEQADAAPPPPAPEALVQGLPDQAPPPLPQVAPDTPLDQLGIPLRDHGESTTTSPRRIESAAASMPGSDKGPWAGLAIFLALLAITTGAVLWGTRRPL